MHLNRTIELYIKIKEQRSLITAPVDNLGCAAFIEPNKNLKILVALLLSSQTKDPVTHSAVLDLDSKIPGGLTLEGIRNSSHDFIQECIKKVGFHLKKTFYLKKLALNKNIPTEYDDLIKLEGIGRKMAILYLFHVHGKIHGVSVDTHVFRIANRIGIKGKTPEKVGLEIEKIFDIEEWPHINTVLVGFGQTICESKKPKCEICIIKDDCPSSLFKK